MANFTIELREIVESGRNIFPFHYDFYDEKKRPKFEQDFIRHFYFREIGAETVDRFILFLEDKMNTVFPYYNKLFETSEMEYAILDNYKLTETITRKQDTEGKARGVSSMVGQNFEKQSSATDENRTTDTTGKNTETGSSENTKTTHSETDTTGTETVDSEGTSNGTKTQTGNNKKKFLDTPQGLTDLSNSKYLTNLTEEDSNNSESANGNTTEDRTTTSEGASETDGSETATGETLVERDSEGSEKVNGKTETTAENEQKNTADSNTRTETKDSLSETIETVRVGNIGVDTDSDVIQKHLKLQKILTRIQEMFFEECEDLFMLVF